MADPLAAFLNGCPALLFVADLDGGLLRTSRALDEYLGARADAVTSLATLFDGEAPERVRVFLRELAEAEGPVGAELRAPEAVLRCKGRVVAGQIHGCLEPTPAAPGSEAMVRIEHAILRHMMDHFDVVLWAVDAAGKFVLHDGKGVRSSGLEPGQFLGLDIRTIYPQELLEPFDRAMAGEPVHYTSSSHGNHWETWNLPLRDDEGETEFCLGVSIDVSAAVRAQAELDRQIETIHRQQQAIRQLATPLIRVWDHVLAVPLIGGMDKERSEELIERLLQEVGRSDVRFTILDLTGVEVLDTSIASHLLRLLDSLRLLGVEGMITGIRSDAAQTMVGIGVDLGRVRTERSLRDALRYCMRALMRDGE